MKIRIQKKAARIGLRQLDESGEAAGGNAPFPIPLDFMLLAAASFAGGFLLGLFFWE